MFAHTSLQEDARRQSGTTPSLDGKPSQGWRRIVNMLVLASMFALLALLSSPLSHSASAHSHVRTAPAAPCDADTACLEQYMLDLINNDRVAAGKAPYTWSDNLANAARAHSDLMASGCGLVHQCPGEDPPTKRIKDAWGPVTGTWHAGENINSKLPSPTYDDAVLQMHQAFMAGGPGEIHYDNIMSDTFQYAGVGIVIDADGHAWLTEDFFGNQ